MDEERRREREDRKRTAQKAMLDAGLDRLREDAKRAKRDAFQKDVELFDALSVSAPSLPEVMLYDILARVIGRERASEVGDFKKHVHGLRTEAEARSTRGGSPPRGGGGGGGGR